jgi:protease I
VDPLSKAPLEAPKKLTVGRDISTLNPSDYAAIIMAANYTSVRLRYENLPPGSVDARALVQSPPVVQFFAKAMGNPQIIKGALCHGLWILTPFPDLLKGRKVTCHTVVMADILNCGVEVVFEKDDEGKTAIAGVVTDKDLVTGFSKDEVHKFINAIAEAILAISPS